MTKKRTNISSNTMDIDNSNGLQRKMLTANEIKTRLKENTWFLDGVTPYLNKMLDFLDEDRLILFLTDTEGCILHIVTSEKISEILTLRFMIPGSFPQPNTVLFDAIDKVLTTQHGAQVTTGKAPIDNLQDNWICWAYPINIHPNTISGTLALCIPEQSASNPLHALLCQTVNCIKQELSFLEEKNKAAKLIDQQVNLFNRYAHADLIVDKSGKIQLVSNEACHMLGITRAEIEHKSISKFIPSWPAITYTDGKWTEIENTEVEISNVPNSGLYLINSKAISRTSNRIDEQICNIRSLKQVLNETNKYMGNTARAWFDDLLGTSPQLKRVIKEAKAIAQTNMPVMLLGEKYTGRLAIAQAIHNHSSRSEFGFIQVDATALSSERLEEVLWGYTESGKANPKKTPKPGAFEFANGGTLYINEIGLLSQSLQNKIFDVIHSGKVNRIGSSFKTTVDVRIICTSSIDLSQKIEAGEFRIDLFYDLSSASLRIPPLRERRADIPLLINHYLGLKAKELDMKKLEIPKKIMLILRRYEWPENFKELVELSQRIILDKGNMFKTFKNERDFKRRNLYLEQLKEVESVTSLEEHEKELIIKAYHAFDGSISKASRRLGISRNTLYLKLKKYGIDA